jgi:hypothetical protein
MLMDIFNTWKVSVHIACNKDEISLKAAKFVAVEIKSTAQAGSKR